MIRTFMKQLMAIALSLLLIFPAIPSEAVGQQPAPAGYSGQGAPLSAAELQKSVAPIALYPDALVAQILGATTFPDQILPLRDGFSKMGISSAQLLHKRSMRSGGIPA
jgi:Protein of unknown function (DUF3300)